MSLRSHDFGSWISGLEGWTKIALTFEKAGILAFVLFGNHGAESQMTKKLRMSDNVSLFDTRKLQRHRLDQIKVVLQQHQSRLVLKSKVPISKHRMAN